MVNRYQWWYRYRVSVLTALRGQVVYLAGPRSRCRDRLPAPTFGSRTSLFGRVDTVATRVLARLRAARRRRTEVVETVGGRR